MSDEKCLVQITPPSPPPVPFSTLPSLAAANRPAEVVLSAVTLGVAKNVLHDIQTRTEKLVLSAHNVIEVAGGVIKSIEQQKKSNLLANEKKDVAMYCIQYLIHQFAVNTDDDVDYFLHVFIPNIFPGV